jgi:hypothetical protein
MRKSLKGQPEKNSVPEAQLLSFKGRRLKVSMNNYNGTWCSRSPTARLLPDVRAWLPECVWGTAKGESD